jgi:hypothetical protein
MRLLSLRLIVSLIVGITLVSSGFSYYEVLGEKRSLRSDLERRAELFGESLAADVERAWNADSNQAALGKPAPERTPDKAPSNELQLLVQRFGNREHLLGVAIYDRQGSLIAITPELRKTLTANPLQVTQAIIEGREENSFGRLGNAPVHILALPIRHQDAVVGGLAVVHDASYIRSQILLVWRQSFFRVLAQVFLIVYYPADCPLEHRPDPSPGGSVDARPAHGEGFIPPGGAGPRHVPAAGA